ncbi:redoxin domain-containing protein [Dysgonomonas reticulitermitis]
MKKVILFLSVLLFVLSSCQDKKSYTVEGSFDTNIYDGQTAYIYSETEDSLGQVTRTIIGSDVIKDSKFSIKGNLTDDPGMGIITVGEFHITDGYDDKAFNPVNFVLEPGTIKFSYSRSAISIGGTEKNDELNKMYEQISRILTVRNEIIDSGKTGWLANNEYQQRTTPINADLQSAIYLFTRNNITNRAGEFYLRESLEMLSRDQILELYNMASESFRSRPQLKTFIEELTRVVPDVGMTYANVELYDKDDKPVPLSDYVGKSKYVLLDFWGSEKSSFDEVPTLIKIYNKYKEKGLEIIGIPQDLDKKEWTESVAKYKMRWPQLADTTTFAIDRYGIEKLPYTILIDQSGTIIAKDLNGSVLENKISGIFDAK